ncbi:MAG: CARDB domain-containing protein, partial [Chitinophagaceae bacterium]
MNTKHYFLPQKIKNTLLLCFAICFAVVINGQTWSCTPTVNTFAGCGNTGTRNCSFGNVLGDGVIKARVINLNSTSATIQITKCSGSFTAGGTGYIKNSICATSGLGGSNTYNSGASTVSITFTHNVSAGQSAVFYPTITSNTAGNYFYAEPITITASPAPSPNLVCGTANISPASPVQGQTATFNFPISNTGTGNYAGALTMWWRSATTGTTLGTSISNLAAGATHTFTSTSAALTSAPGSYVLSIERPDGSLICSRNVTVVAAPSPNLVCGTASISPANPVQGQTATFNFPISNTGTGNYAGALTMWWRSATTGTTLGASISNLAAGSTHTFTSTSAALTSAPGSYELSIEKPDGTKVCARNVTVVAAPTTTCITWTNPPTAGQNAEIAANYLCNKGIIVNNQDGTFNQSGPIRRRDLARICYLGLKDIGGVNMPSDSFPTPFNDMQTLNANTS